METKELYREILNEHNLNPEHKKHEDGAKLGLNGENPSGGDKLTPTSKTDNGIITDGWFTGTGCAVSQASADMMLDLVIGKKQDEALRLGDIFMDMIKGTAAPDTLEELDEAAALQDISKMPARVKCAVLGWRTMKEMFASAKTSAAFGNPHCAADAKIGH